jgi:hypothetical protein
MKGHGVDIQLGGYPFKDPQGFTWRTQFTLGFNKTEITKLDVTRNIWNLVSAEGGAKLGKPHRGLYSIDFDKLNARGGTRCLSVLTGHQVRRIFGCRTMKLIS